MYWSEPKTEIKANIDDTLGTAMLELSRVLHFDLQALSSDILNDAFRNKIEDLKKEFE